MLTSEQLSLIRYAKRGWSMALLIGETEAGIRREKSSLAGGCGGDWSYDTDAKGVHGTRRERTGLAGRLPDGRTRWEVTVTWTEWRNTVAELPMAVREKVRAAFRAWQTEHVRWMVRPAAPGQRPGPWCEPPPHWRREREADMDAAVAEALALLEPAEAMTLW